MNDLGVWEPHEDTKRLWPSKEGLGKEILPRILADNGKKKFDAWHDNISPRLLEMHGEARTGITTMMVAMIEYLQEETKSTKSTYQPSLSKLKFTKTKFKQPTLLSYFFCQLSDDRRNNVVDVLKGLIYQLISRCNDLDPPIHLKQCILLYVDAKKGIIKGLSAFYMLRDILSNILQHDSLDKVYLLVNGLDKCIVGLSQLLDAINNKNCSAKWLVTTTRKGLVVDCDQISISLSQLFALVDASIKDAMPKSDPAKRTEMRENLVKKSYLWIDLAFQAQKFDLLKDIVHLEPETDFDLLSEKVIKQIEIRINSVAAYQKISLLDLCEEMLRWTTMSYYPLRLVELDALMGPRDFCIGTRGISKLIDLWNPLLVIIENKVYFRYLGIKDYIFSHKINHSKGGHWSTMLRCLELMTNGLRKDAPNKPGSEWAVRYACCH